jgi:diketogulonate reductase-like aldo/keto reductase
MNLHENLKIPVIGFGVFRIPPGERTYKAVLEALKIGYRHIDCSPAYKNEDDVGRAIKDSKIPRNEIFVTNKLSLYVTDSELVESECIKSLKTMKLDSIDLFLIHSPPNSAFSRKQLWIAMEKLVHKGIVKSIGVSNYGISHLKELLTFAKIKPSIN